MKRKKTVAVIGLGVFGLDLVKKLKELKAEVIAIDKDSNSAAIAGEYADRTFICDSGNYSALEELGIDKVDHVIVAMSQGNHDSAVATIATTLALKKLNVKDIVVRVDNDVYSDILKEIGATYLFSPLKIASERLSNIVLADNYDDYFNISEEYSVLQIEVDENFNEVKLRELNSPKKYGVVILLIKRDGEEFMPTGDDCIKAKDEVFVFGAMDNANKLAKELSK